MLKEILLKNQKNIENNLWNFYTSQEITKYLTNYIIHLFEDKYEITKEVELEGYSGKNNRLGIIDLRINTNTKTLDIEIDRGNKLMSLDKLSWSKKVLGHDVLWIKWGKQINEKAIQKLKENNLDYIYISTLAHKKRIGR